MTATLIRPGSLDDISFIEEMLFEAFFWDQTAARPTLNEFKSNPEFSRLLAGWGRQGDTAVIAEIGGCKVGAAWYRFWTYDDHSYGFVDSATPELGIAVTTAHRSRGVGRKLLRSLIDLAGRNGVASLSLSVSPSNFARNLYEAEGFRKVGVSGDSWTLLLQLDA